METDQTTRISFASPRSLLAAVGYFTRIPVPAAGVPLESALPWLPVVGWITGGLSALLFFLLSHILPQPAAVVLVLAAATYLTGAMHEDGLADTADGLGGAWTREDRLRIMKDPRTGSFGVTALVLSYLTRYTALVSLPAVAIPGVLLVAHTLSRLAPLWMVQVYEYARGEKSRAAPLTLRNGASAVLFALMTAAAPWWLLYLRGENPLSLVSLPVPVLVTLLFSYRIRKGLGGYTGDTLGALQQIVEISVYLMALLPFSEHPWISI